ncbi:MAG: hypothetical protein KGJ43_07305, partial [Acidobacteriota bacterium]|nr:hypothetical protein [Acidobacteriota bacterium]
LTPEELRSKGWQFTGTAKLPSFTCQNGILGRLFGWVLTTLLSGPENSYALRIGPPVEGDNYPPVFAGLKSALRCHRGPELENEKMSFGLTWEPATDDVTPQSQIVYRIYQATSRGGENFSTPTYTTAPGATTFETPLLANGNYYFVVRARDQAGLEDLNTVERQGENVCL